MPDGAYIYAFEELGDDLPRPPMAALRALQAKGCLISARGWRELPVDVRQALAREGARDEVGGPALEAAIRKISLQHVKMMPSVPEPSRDEVPPELRAALGPVRAVSTEQWQRLRALDRRVLATLVRNTRLLARAVAEIVPTAPASSDRPRVRVARCEIALRADVLEEVGGPRFHDGRALALAGVAGRRAARRIAETFDLLADSTVGPVELEWGIREGESVLFWQAHVSAWDGTFFPAAALLAATTAAVAVYDMVKELDPEARVGVARVCDEPWEAGRGDVEEMATAFYSASGPRVVRAMGKRPDATVMTGPPVMDEPPVPSSKPRSAPKGDVYPPRSSRAPAPVSGPMSPRATGPSARLFLVVSVIAVMAVLALIVLSIGLARSAGRL
jgi:cyclic pyranopterin phosphate synthase